MTKSPNVSVRITKGSLGHVIVGGYVERIPDINEALRIDYGKIWKEHLVTITEDGVILDDKYVLEGDVVITLDKELNLWYSDEQGHRVNLYIHVEEITMSKRNRHRCLSSD